jgi:hypothetical protein
MAKKVDAEKVELTRASWARHQVLLNPEITLEQIQTAYDKTKFPKKDRPKKEGVIHSARSQLRKRWEWESLDEIPLHQGGLSVRGFVWRYFEMFGYEETTYEDVHKYMGLDGIHLTKANYSNAHAVYGKGPHKADSPDANQDAGPRAGAPGKRKYKRKKSKRRGKKEIEATTLQKYEKMEKQLDALMVEAEALKDGKLATALRGARRRAGAFLVAHQE